jgi:hypothetical protein
MTINAIKKGKRGEVEFCEWIQKNLDILTERNYNQAKGGADVIIKDFIFEVKRREVLNLNSWWNQVLIAKENHREKDLIPVVCFRQNRKAWEFLIPAALIGIEQGYLRANETVFKQFCKRIIKGNL